MNQSAAELFQASCGAGASLRVLVTAKGQPPCEHLFDRPFFIAGRDPRSCVRLQAAKVSQRHAYFQVIEGRLLCVDLSSRKGVVWPGGTIRPSGWLAPSSGVQISSCSFFPAIDRPADEPPPADHGDWDPLRDRISRPGWPQAILELSGGDQPTTYRCRLNRMVALVGCAPACRIRLTHRSASRFHCSLVWTPLGVWLVDLLSRQGTFLNGRSVTWARIADGDEVGVGAYRMRFSYGAEPSSTEQLLPVVSTTADVSAESTDTRSPALPDPGSTQPVHAEDCLLPTQGQSVALSVQGGSGADVNLLLPVMQQFNLMQQQLCDQFQQTTLMMFRMFTTMHQEQTTLIREEMQQIQRITGELQTLQRQVRDGVLPERESVPSREKPARAAAAGAPARPVPMPKGFSGGKLPADGAGDAAQPTRSATPPPPDTPPLQTPSPDVVDAWLNKRIGELQAERQTHWQRVLSFLSGE